MVPKDYQLSQKRFQSSPIIATNNLTSSISTELGSSLGIHMTFSVILFSLQKQNIFSAFFCSSSLLLLRLTIIVEA